MVIVIVHREKITYGSFYANGLLMPKFFNKDKKIKCRSDESFGNKRVKRGKPRKQETQIMVGELGWWEFELPLGPIYR